MKVTNFMFVTVFVKQLWQEFVRGLSLVVAESQAQQMLSLKILVMLGTNNRSPTVKFIHCS
jgi:hypothetical protein